MLYEFGMTLLPKSLPVAVEEASLPGAREEAAPGDLHRCPSLESVSEDLVKIHVKAVMNHVSLGLESSQSVYAEIAIANCNAEVRLLTKII